MNKKVIGIAIAVLVAIGLGFIIYDQTFSGEYMPADDEIALHIQLEMKEDVGLLVYDYSANSHQYSGGTSNADKSLIKPDDNIVVVLNKQQLNSSSDAVELSMQFRIITEYVTPTMKTYIRKI